MTIMYPSYYNLLKIHAKVKIDPNSTKETIVLIIPTLIWILGCLIAILGNMLIAVIIIFCPKLRGVRGTTYLYFISRAVADILYALSIPFMAVYYWIGYWSFGETMCKLTLALEFFLVPSSMFAVFIGIDCCIVSVYPKYLYRNQIFQLLSALTWVVAIGLACCIISFDTRTGIKDDECYNQLLLTGGEVLCWLVLVVVIPTVILVLCGTVVHQAASGTQADIEMTRKLEYLIFSIGFIIISTELPFLIMQIIQRETNIPINSFLHAFLYSLSSLRCAFNPILYIIFNPDLRFAIVNKFKKLPFDPTVHLFLTEETNSGPDPELTDDTNIVF